MATALAREAILAAEISHHRERDAFHPEQGACHGEQQTLQLNPLVLSDPRFVCDLLFRCASETLLEIAADPKHLGARIGVLAVLHTWGMGRISKRGWV